MTSNQRTIKIGHHKLHERYVGGVHVVHFRIDKRRTRVARDGTQSEEDFSEHVYLLDLPGSGRKLWLKPYERRRVLEALQLVDLPEVPLESGEQAVAAAHKAAPSAKDVAPSTSASTALEPSLAERVAVHRAIEWMRVHDAWPDPQHVATEAEIALSGVGVYENGVGPVMDLLIAEVRRALARREKILASIDEAVYPAGTDEAGRLADPCGELEGMRMPTYTLLYRATRQYEGEEEDDESSLDVSGTFAREEQTERMGHGVRGDDIPRLSGRRTCGGG